MSRILGIDFGLARIGLALSDESKIIASPLCVSPNGKNQNHTILNIQKSVVHPIEKIIIGFPLYLNGKESPMCQEVRKFAELLRQVFQIPLVLWDERLTSSQIERTLKEAKLSRKKRSSLSDTLAATLILQNFLDTHERNSLVLDT